MSLEIAPRKKCLRTRRSKEIITPLPAAASPSARRQPFSSRLSRMARANTEGNNPVAKVEADCFGWLWQLVIRGLDGQHNIEVNKDAKVVVLKAVNHEREDEQDGLDVEDDAEENDGPDEYWDEESDDEDKGDGSGQQFCCKVFVLLGLLKTFVLLGLLKTGGKKYVPTRLMANLFLESCFQQLSNKL